MENKPNSERNLFYEQLEKECDVDPNKMMKYHLESFVKIYEKLFIYDTPPFNTFGVMTNKGFYIISIEHEGRF